MDKKIVTIQLTPGFPDGGVEKCSFTVVNSAFSPCYQENRKQSEQLQPFLGKVLSSYRRLTTKAQRIQCKTFFFFPPRLRASAVNLFSQP
ncbi:MAG: hypothetical protein Q9M26_02525 [Mariprofundales bacterium]|nr:hypothetical protein [Mariprofundales bacterium]